MNPNSDSIDLSELDLSKERITVNIDKLDHEIITNLIGVMGNSKSAIIAQIIKEWINQNSEKMMNTWEIDLAGIKRQILAEVKGIELEKELKDYELSIINKLPEIFDSVEEIELEELAELLGVNVLTVRKIIIFHKKRLEDVGLDLIYKSGTIINSNLSKS
jgi:hypothetical protein